MYSIKVYKSNGSKTEHNVSSLDIATIKKEIGFSDDDVAIFEIQDDNSLKFSKYEEFSFI